MTDKDLLKIRGYANDIVRAADATRIWVRGSDPHDKCLDTILKSFDELEELITTPFTSDGNTPPPHDSQEWESELRERGLAEWGVCAFVEGNHENDEINDFIRQLIEQAKKQAYEEGYQQAHKDVAGVYQKAKDLNKAIEEHKKEDN